MKLKINKFKTIQDREISIPAEISGGNGTGKTTILEAISFCLTGKDLNGATMEQIYDNRQDLHDALKKQGWNNHWLILLGRTYEALSDRPRAMKLAKALASQPDKLDAEQKKQVKELLLRLR